MNVILLVIERLRENEFFRGVTILVSGTALSQLMIVILTPVLTRLYSPEEFGILSVYLSIVLTVSIVTSWYYDTAIPLPKKEADAINLLGLSMAILLFNTLVAAVLLSVLKKPLLNIFDTDGLKDILFFLPFSIFGFGLFKLFEMWMVRKEDYKHITAGKVRMNLTQIFSQAGLGLVWPSSGSLMTGEVMGRLVGGGGMAYVSWKKLRYQFECLSVQSVKQMARRYIRFPLIASWSTLLRSLTHHLPTLFIAFALGVKAAGWYLLADRILALPDALLGYSVKQVYVAKSAKILHVSFEKFKALFWSMFKRISIISFIIYTLLTLIAPFLFPIAFGDSWRGASVFMQCLSFFYFSSLIMGPISEVFILLEEQYIQALAEIIRFVLLLVGIAIANLFLEQSWHVVLSVSLAGAVGNLGIGIFSWIVLKRGEKKFQQIGSTDDGNHYLSS